MLRIHAAERIEPLAERLAEVLRAAPSDPMTSEWIAVPSAGMRRWLQLELARHLGSSGPGRGDGVAANLEMAFPGSLRLRVLEAERDPEDPDPWRVERLAWAVLDAAALAAADPRLAALVDLPAGASRYGRARRVADLFDRYHLHRPAMIRAWAAGQDVDGAGQVLADHHRWQPLLWRLVRQRLGTPSPPERLVDVLGRLRADDLALDLPDRVVLFGLSLLPGGPGFLELVDALGASRDVEVFLLEASPAMASELRSVPIASRPIAGRPIAGRPAGDGNDRTRADDQTARQVSHPLLRSWGRLHRETAVLLADAERRGLSPVQRIEAASPPAVTVLRALQADIRADAAPSASLRVEPTDRSVQFHACHGATRQVEVLRDLLLHLLADDPTLSEDDIVVVCPALERFAPLIEAVFGPSSDDGAEVLADRPPALRYRIADRSIRAVNPVLGATQALLELVGGRFDSPAVLNFLAIAPVRQRFRFTDDHLGRIGEWVAETNVSWGLDAEHRAPRGLPVEITTNTWQAAIDRLMIGSAVSDDELALAVGEVVPYGVESDDAVVAGRFAELLWQLRDLAVETARMRSVTEWIELVRSAADALFETPRDAEWQLEALLELLADIVESAELDGRASDAELDYVDLRRLLADRLLGAAGRPDFFRGGITISSMTPLRWIPHRVVCVLGMDQAAFGAGSIDGDDLAALNPVLGDRDPRAESRQSLLEVVLAAGDHLVVVRDGHDVRSNQPIPRAVSVSELRDAVIGVVEPQQQHSFAERLEVAHPRQAFDERCFEAGGINATGPWGFDGAALAGAIARRDRAATPVPFLTARLAPHPTPVIELAALHGFLKHPVKTFLQGRLGVRLPRRDDAVTGRFPVNLAALDLWRVGDRLLSARLAGATVQDWERIERRLGTLPPAVLGDAAIDSLIEQIDRLTDAAFEHGYRRGPGEPVAIDVTLDDGTRIVGSVLGRLEAATPGPARVQFSKSKPEHRVGAWLDLMALVAHDPSVDWRSVAVNRSDAKQPAVVDLVPATGMGNPDARRADAIRALEVAVDCYRRGSQEPIPLFGKLSHRVYLGKQSPADWASFGGFGEGSDPANVFVYGGFELDDLMSIEAEPDDPPGTGRRVERFANYLHGTIGRTVSDRDIDRDVDVAGSGR